MTSDDQQFLDLLASIPQDMARYGGRIADYIEKHTNAIASDIRDAIDHASWLPDSIKPVRSNGTSGHFFSRPPPPPQSLYEKTVTFISDNRTAIAIVAAFTGTTIYLAHRRKRQHARKRRAKKLPNGAKKEIVVVACSTFHDPLTKSLAVDLERRGYVVYVTVSSTDEDSLVQQEAKADLRPLWIDLTSTVPNPSIDTHPNLEPIRELLSKSSRPATPDSRRSGAGSGSAMSNMTFAGIVVFPGSSGYPTDILTKIHPSDVVDSINTRLLAPLLTIQQFYPMLQRYSTDAKAPASIVIAYPSIPQSLSPPTQIPETIITSSLSSLAASLRREVRASRSNITISELKLGNFDLGSVTSKSLHRSVYTDPANSTSSSQLTLTHWHSSQRAAIQRSTLGQSSLIKGSSAREFHNAVFDALAPPQTFKPFGKYEWTSRKRNQILFVGQGARLYDIAGKAMPDGLVGWMMGYRSTGSDSPSTRPDLPRTPVLLNPDIQPNVSASASASTFWGSSSHASESAIWEKV